MPEANMNTQQNLQAKAKAAAAAKRAAWEKERARRLKKK